MDCVGNIMCFCVESIQIGLHILLNAAPVDLWKKRPGSKQK